MTETNPAIKVIQTDKAPAAIGPYAQATIANGFVFCSGQIPIDPTKEGTHVLQGSVQAQTTLVMSNLKTVLEACGSSLGSVVKTTVYLKDMDDFVEMNNVYAEFFGAHKPARAAFQVARLPKDVAVEIECVALVEA